MPIQYVTLNQQISDRIEEDAIHLYDSKDYTLYVGDEDTLLEMKETLISFIQNSPFLAYDIETAKRDGRPFSKNEGVGWDDDLFACFSISDGNQVWVINKLRCSHQTVADIIKEIMKRPLLGQNIKFDLKFTYRDFGLLPSSILFDTEIASRVVHSEKLRHHALGDIMSRELGILLDKTLQKSNWGSIILTYDQIKYSALDTLLLPKLMRSLVTKLNKNPHAYNSNKESPFFKIWGCSNRVLQLEMSLLPVFIKMESMGFFLDNAMAATLYKQSLDKENQLTWAFCNAVGSAVLKVRSDKEVKKWIDEHYPDAHHIDPDGTTHYFRDQMKMNKNKQMAPNIGKEEMEPFVGLGYPVIDIVHAIKVQTNLKNRLEEFLDNAKLHDDRVKTSYRQIGTETGRTSCPKPNLQNIPSRGESKLLRKLFIAPQKKKLIVCDYSQFQLVICAEIAKDKEMTRIINTKGDLHYYTASILLNKDISLVTKDERQKAKAANFGLIFGMGANSLIVSAKRDYKTDLTLEEAHLFIERFFNIYKGVKNWHQEVKKTEQGGKFTCYTLFGRKIVADRFTSATNYGIQGSEADIIKLAMVMIDLELQRRKSSAYFVNMVHDELVVEADEEEADEICELISSTMIKAGKMIMKTVDVGADGKVVDCWYDGK